MTFFLLDDVIPVIHESLLLFHTTSITRFQTLFSLNLGGMGSRKIVELQTDYRFVGVFLQRFAVFV